MLDGMVDIYSLAFGIVAVLFFAGIVFARLYKRASKEISYVRTGFGGQKVVMNGGTLVFPVLHETIPVNMNTLRLEVRRDSDQALITRDRMRVDVVAEFYVRVQPTADSIANAAQTLGNRTMEREELKELVEGKFVDALRAVAAEMSMTELHEKRIDFVQKVQMAVTEDLLKNGLELESVSLTGLDQTAKEYFNPNNAFDAEGLTRLTEEIELRRKIRNDIEQDTAVQISTKNLEAEKQTLEIARDSEYARLEQEREIELRKADQDSDIKVQQAVKERNAEQAEIMAQKEVQESRIQAEKSVEEQKILKEKVVETQNIEKQKQVELSNQDRDIAVAEKSKAQSEAKAEADKARALAVMAEEQVKTAREKEIADREKQIELIEAAKLAEREAIGIQVAAEAEKKAADFLAAAVRIEADGAAQKIKIIAEGEAEAEKAKADASEVRYKVEAEGKHAINEASNILSPEQVAMQIKIKLIENLDKIIRESVKPMESIEGIKILQLEGLGGVGGNGGGGGHGPSQGDGTGGNLADQVVNSALRYRAQAPLVDSLLKEIGLDGSDINSVKGAIGNIFDKDDESMNSKKLDESGEEGNGPVS
jgi:uncharacterized membrane protein YqiK